MAALLNDWSSTLQRKIALGALALAMLLAFTAFVPPSTPGPLERDFEAYYAAGATVNAGGDPYSRAIWTAEARIPGVNAARDELLPFIGPAAALPFWSLLARMPYRTALAIWTGLLFAAYITIVVCALRLARAPRDPMLYAGAGATAIAAAPMISDFALGQAALISAAGIAAAIVAYRARRLPGAFIGTLVCAAQPNLALALLGRMRSGWDMGVAASAAAAFAAVTLVAGGGVPGFVMYLRHLSEHGAAERFITIQHTPVAIAFAFGAPPAAAIAIGAGVAVTAIIATAALIIRERLDATTATLVCCAALPLAIPFFHEHDFVIEVLPALVLAMRARGRCGIASISAVLLFVDWFGLAQRHAAQGQIVALGFAMAFGFAAIGQTPSRWGFAGAATLAVLAALTWAPARAHLAPTWPDALPLAYHANPADDAGRVWAAEQRVAGLVAVDPVWAALRSLPLAGCVLLTVALIADARATQGKQPKRATSFRPAQVAELTPLGSFEGSTRS